MNRTMATASAALATLVLTITPVSQASAQRCVSGADIRGQVSAFVHSLKGEVDSKATRHAVKGALIESVKAARGAKADTRHENRGLGKEIRLIARQLKDAKDKLEHDALIAQIHALQDQKKAAHADREDVQTLRSDLKRVARDLSETSDTRAQGRQVAEFVHNLMAQFAC
jgi:hypothetical protein